MAGIGSMQAEVPPQMIEIEAVGAIASLWGARTLAFTFTGLVIGSILASMPFVVQPLQQAFEELKDPPQRDRRPIRAMTQVVAHLVERLVEHVRAEQRVRVARVGGDERLPVGLVEVAGEEPDDPLASLVAAAAGATEAADRKSVV